MHLLFCCKMHSIGRYHSLMPDACETFRRASLHIKSLTSTKFAAVQAHRSQPLSSAFSIHSCCRFYAATWPDWFCWNSYCSR